MPYIYKALSEQEQHDMLTRTLLANERDHFSHTATHERITEMLKTLPSGPFKDRMAGTLLELESRLAEVGSILDATTAQLPADDSLVQASIERVKAEEAAAR